MLMLNASGELADRGTEGLLGEGAGLSDRVGKIDRRVQLFL